MSRVVVTTCIACLIAAGGIGVASYYVQAQQAQDLATLIPFTASYRHLMGEVKISGTSKAQESVDLSFKIGGIVDSVFVKTGDSVSTSTVLAALRTGALKSQLAQARASLKAEVAKLHELRNGTRPEQVAVTQSELESAQNGLRIALMSAQSIADTTVRFTIDNQFLLNPNQYSSKLKFETSDRFLEEKILSERRKIETDLSSWRSRASSLQNASADADALIAASRDMQVYLQAILVILNDLTQIVALNDSTELSTNQAAITAARTTVSAVKKEVQSAQAEVQVVRRQLGLDEAGPTSESELTQEAVVEGAYARVNELADELQEQSIVAPFSGVVTSVDSKQGEVAVAGAKAISLISHGPLKVEGYVPEVHYGSIAIGNPVRIELDAFRGESFDGVLGLIDPTAIPRDGVPNFKVTVYFTNQDPRVRPGLTTSAFIETADKPHALAVPVAAVTGTGESTTVLRLSGGVVERIPVTLGVMSTDGYIEVVSGLSENDSVLVDETKQYRIVPN